MERVTISMSDEFAAELSAFMDSAGYANLPEALRDLARLGLQHPRINADSGECFATLSYVFNHQTRELPKRLTGAHHDHHHLHVATMLCISTMKIVSRLRCFAERPGQCETSPIASLPGVALRSGR